MRAIESPVLFRSHLLRWFRKHGRKLPWRDTRDPYAIWISEIMLQQTQVVTVLDYYKRWMRQFPDIKSLAAAPEAGVLAAWQGLGYYTRARNLCRAAGVLVRDHEGKMPATLEEIQRLPGIGRYTAGAIATFSYNARTPIVDANIARVIARLIDLRIPIDTSRGRTILWNEAERLLPTKNAGLHNSALMELGALVCRPRRPDCVSCPVKKFCRTPDPELLPVKKPRRETVKLTENAALIIKNGSILLEQQTGSRWSGLWKLPVITDLPVYQNQARSISSGPIFQINYPFTHHRITLCVFSQQPPREISNKQRWHKIATLDQLAMATPHRRAVLAVLKK